MPQFFQDNWSEYNNVMYQLRLTTWIYQRYDRAVFILKKLETCLNANHHFTKKSANRILYVLSSGCNSGIIVFDNNLSNDGFVIICKINKDDTSFIEDNFKIVRNLFPNLLKSTASEIKTKLYVNDSLLVYIPFNNPNKPYVNQIYQLTGGGNE